MEEKYKDLLDRLNRLDGNLSRIIAAKQIMLCANNETLIENVDNTYEAHGCSFFLSSARNEVLSGLHRILEIDGKDKCSFKKLIKMRLDKDINTYIENKILYHPTAYRIIRLCKKYEAFEAENAELIEDIRTFRHYHLAHSLSRIKDAPFTKEAIKYEELFILLDKISELFEEFTRLVQNGCIDNASKNNTWKRYAEKFWAAMATGTAANKETHK